MSFQQMGDVSGNTSLYNFYGSENLIDWDHLVSLGIDGGPFGIWECPDLFPLEFNGEKRVLLVSTTNAP